MSSPPNNAIQKNIISQLRTITALIAELVAFDSSANEIREDQWQGDNFVYPNVRVRMIRNAPDGDTNDCNGSTIDVGISVFTQDYSSLEADKIAGIISSSLHGKTYSANNVELFLRTTNIIPAIRADKITWRSECLMSGKAASL